MTGDAHPNSPYLLTIAIPTYNRAPYLERGLAALEPQLRPELPIELIVSDNASPDDTDGVVERYRARGLRIKYLKNATNLGPDGNILRCFEEAGGKYVWILGDDDFVRPGGIEKILSHMERSEYDLIYVSSVAFTHAEPPPENVPELGSEVFEDAEALARRVNVFFTFVSGVIVNKETVSRVPHPPYEELLGTYLVQLGWVYAAVNHHRKSLYIRDQIVATLTDNAGGYKLFQVFGPNLKNVTEKRIRSAAIRRMIINGVLLRFFPAFLLYRPDSETKFLREDPHRILSATFGGNFRYWLFDFPVLKLPLSLARCWVFMVRQLNRIDAGLGSPMLGF